MAHRQHDAAPPQLEVSRLDQQPPSHLQLQPQPLPAPQQQHRDRQQAPYSLSDQKIANGYNPAAGNASSQRPDAMRPVRSPNLTGAIPTTTITTTAANISAPEIRSSQIPGHTQSQAATPTSQHPNGYPKDRPQASSIPPPLTHQPQLPDSPRLAPSLTSPLVTMPSSTTSAQYPSSNSAAAPAGEKYRTHLPTTAPSVPSTSSTSLPSMRSLDAQQAQALSSATPIPLASAGAVSRYYQQHMGITYPNRPTYGLSSGINEPHIVLSGGRHKREIKRRTKTGCLTCRKRRIKCDEGHPTCNNCRKSKRDCLGYDPIFKNQQQSLTALQSASNQPTLAPHPTTATIIPPSPSPSQAPPRHTPPVFEPGIAGPGLVAGRIPLLGKKMKLEELLDLGGPPLPSAGPPNRAMMDEITKIYYEVYVPGLTHFFETQWYNFKPSGPPNPVNILLENKPLLELLATFLKLLSSIQSTDPAHMTNTGNMETRVIWALSSLAYGIPPQRSEGSNMHLPVDNPGDARSRVLIFETLLSGEHLHANPCLPPPKTGDSIRIREYEFWFYLGEFLRLPDTPEANRAAERDQMLAQVRRVLDGRENRDVLYSFAVVRELAPNFPPGYENEVPQYLDESEPRNRLAVAAKFVQEEAKTTGGTTNVVRRFAELAIKALLNPGVNVSRR